MAHPPKSKPLRRKSALIALTLTAAALSATAALAHHSMAMFDKTGSRLVEGSIAKFEWTNPHAFVWMYVKNATSPNGYELYAFESDAVNILGANGWSKDSLKAGDRVSIRYFPLLDGRPGGYLVWVERADGGKLIGDRDTPITGTARELQRLEAEQVPAPPGKSGDGQ